LNFTPYSYQPEKSIEVYQKTEKFIQENSDIQKRISDLGWIYHITGMIIPQNFDNLFSGHFFPFIDSWEEAQISFNLCCFGFYKQAFVSLRSALELGMLSVYFNINDDGEKIIKDWVRSSSKKEADTPNSRKIWNILLSNENIKRFDEKFDLMNEYDKLGYLHNYVHTKGQKYSNRYGKFKSNFQTFEPEMLEKWFESYERIIVIINTLHLVKYPISVVRYDYSKKFGIDIPSFGGLEEYNINNISKILPDGYIPFIEEIAKTDKKTQETIKEIDAIPDITKAKLERQYLDIEKSLIEGMSYKKWLKHKQKELKIFEQDDFSDEVKKRIDVLKKWAIENDFYEKTKIDKFKNKG